MSHFAFYAPGYLRYWRGNMRAFGFLGGLHASICLSFPFLGTLMTWKYRKMRLEIRMPEGD